jgi:hypothetical protein
MITTVGRAYEQRGTVYVKTTRPAEDHLSDDVTVLWHDSRKISAEQRRKAWALMTEIAAASMDDKDDTYRDMRVRFTAQNFEMLQGRLFHLSEATVTEARLFITMLVDIILEYDIPTRAPLLTLADDLERYTYSALLHKKCVCCGKPAELHHVDQIGMGYDRKTKPQLGAQALPLCRKHHEEYHLTGQRAFLDTWHVVPTRIDQRLAKVYRIPTRARAAAGAGMDRLL